jgi:hypothetical protein
METEAQGVRVIVGKWYGVLFSLGVVVHDILDNQRLRYRPICDP